MLERHVKEVILVNLACAGFWYVKIKHPDLQLGIPLGMLTLMAAVTWCLIGSIAWGRWKNKGDGDV